MSLKDGSGPTLDGLLADVADRPCGLTGVTAAITGPDGLPRPVRRGTGLRPARRSWDRRYVVALTSLTEAITAAVCLQLVEEGALDLDAPAADCAPEIGEVRVFNGFGPAGQFRLRAPTRPVTTRTLLLHRSGYGYEFANETIHTLRDEYGR